MLLELLERAKADEFSGVDIANMLSLAGVKVKTDLYFAPQWSLGRLGDRKRAADRVARPPI